MGVYAVRHMINPDCVGQDQTEGSQAMSYGTTRKFSSKKALKEAVAAGEEVTVFDTSLFDNKGTVPLATLAGTSAVIVGPDVHSDRRWYANVKTNKAGKVVIV